LVVYVITAIYDSPHLTHHIFVRIKEEAAEALGNKSEITAEDVGKLVYTEQVLISSHWV
jgi:hypothetical protein